MRSSSPRRTASSNAVHSTSSSRDKGKSRALGCPLHRVVGPPRALQEGRNRPRRAELADEIDVADVDPELERRGGHERPQFAALQALLGEKTPLLGQAAVVRGDEFPADQLGQVARHALGHAPRVDEDERGAMLARELGKPQVDLPPDIARHDRFERGRRNLDREVALARVSGIDDGAARGRHLRAHEKARDFLDRLLRCGQAHTRRRCCRQCSKALERKREMAAALVGRERVDFVDDHGARGREHRASGIGAEQHIERFGRGDDNVRWPAPHARTLALRRIAGAHERANFDVPIAERCELGANARERRFEIALDVVGERLQRRDVDDAGFVRQRALDTAAHESVDRREKRGQRLARAGRRRHEDMAALLDRGPRARLSLGGRGKGLAKPGPDSGVEHFGRCHGIKIAAGGARCKLLQSGLSDLASRVEFNRFLTGPRVAVRQHPETSCSEAKRLAVGIR